MGKVWILVLIMGNGHTSLTIEGYTSKESCEAAAKEARNGGRDALVSAGWDVAKCIPRE